MSNLFRRVGVGAALLLSVTGPLLAQRGGARADSARPAQPRTASGRDMSRDAQVASLTLEIAQQRFLLQQLDQRLRAAPDSLRSALGAQRSEAQRNMDALQRRLQGLCGSTPDPDGWLGLGFNDATGAVGEVDATYPAALAGIVPGDTIVSINGKAPGEYGGARWRDTVVVQVRHQGAIRTVNITAARRPFTRYSSCDLAMLEAARGRGGAGGPGSGPGNRGGQPQFRGGDGRGGRGATPDSGRGPWRGDPLPFISLMSPIPGAELHELSPNLARALKVADGVLVLEVARSSPADRAGLVSADVIVKAGNAPVTSVFDLRRAFGRDSVPVALDVVRDGQHVTLSVAR